MKTILFLLVLFYQSISVSHAGEILATKLSDEAYLLKSKDYGPNIGLIKTSKGLVIIDPMPGEENLARLENNVFDIYQSSVNYILNTHSHRDHSGGNEYFSSKGGVFVETTEGFEELESVLVVSHSKSDRVFFHPSSNTIFAGDVYDGSWHPTFYAGGSSGFNSAIKAILALGDEGSLIVPGHGAPTSKHTLREFQKNTNDWISIVRKLSNEGSTVEEIKKNPQVLETLNRFNIDKKDVFIPEKNLVRFIERTIATIELGN